MRGLALLVLASLLIAAAVVGIRDPEEPLSVALLVLSLGVGAGALAAMFLSRTRRRAGRRVPGMRRAMALRRGAEFGAVVALLLWLRIVDGLSVITASFVIAAFAVAEFIASARPASSR
jgi:hypothetical protein